MIDILNQIKASDLSPNQYFLLYGIKTGLEVPNVDVDSEMRVLIEKGHIVDGLLTTSLFSENEEKTLRSMALRFRSIFPPTVLPTGIHARGKESQVLTKLKAFMKLYSYDWDIIFAATEKYVARYKANRYLYMQSASNFILDKNGDSTLALECDTLEYNDVDEAETAI